MHAYNNPYINNKITVFYINRP